MEVISYLSILEIQKDARIKYEMKLRIPLFSIDFEISDNISETIVSDNISTGLHVHLSMLGSSYYLNKYENIYEV